MLNEINHSQKDKYMTPPTHINLIWTESKIVVVSKIVEMVNCYYVFLKSW
jgi:hypothetical protein